jgi:hypothetical protein
MNKGMHYNNQLIKMEGLEQKLDRVNTDISKIIELYDFAEK